jgi:pyridine nucleotide-disulfide oxidoreductase family protein
MKRLLLAGGGQAHVFVLRELARRQPKNAEVVLVTPSEQLIYSGMLPGWVAGHYQLPELTIPLIPLAAAAGVRVVTSRIVAVDLATKTTYTSSGAAIEFDLLSIATGSVLDFDAVPGARDYALPLRPLEDFVAGWQSIYMHVQSERDPIRLTIIGGGAGGAEIALAVMYRLRTVQDAVQVQLVTGNLPILPGHGERVRALVLEALVQYGVRLIAANAAQLEPNTVVLEDGSALASDVTMLVTGPAADACPGRAGMATDERGFITVNEHLQSVSHPFVFAAGDAATFPHAPRPKSGVYAVRAGPRLALNLLAALEGSALRSYHPQRRALYLISTGAQHAIASWGPWAIGGDWVWRWKDRIDRAYLAQFRLP